MWGEEGNPAFIALHGWLDNCATFQRLLPHLPGLNVFAVDLPGHGQSDHLNFYYSFGDWIPIVCGVANQLGWDKFGIIGHSMGAAISTMVAATVPKRVSELVLIEGIVPLMVQDDEIPERFSRLVNTLGRERPVVRYKTIAEMRQARASMGYFCDPINLDPIIERGSKKIDDKYTWSSDPYLTKISPHRFNLSQILSFLSRLEAKALLIRGRQGLKYFQDVEKEIFDHYKGLQVVDLEGRHHLHLEDPQPVAAEIRQFLNR